MKIAKKDMTQAILKEHMNYDPMTGHLTWRIKHCSKVVPGGRVGSLSKRDGHIAVNFMGSVYRAHRLIWLWWYGEHPKNHIDHINHIETDNRICNLRSVTQQENNLNQPKRRDNKSGVTGVRKLNREIRPWLAEMGIKGKRVFLKAFDTMEEAAAARKEQELIHGFHVNHGN